MKFYQKLFALTITTSLTTIILISPQNAAFSQSVRKKDLELMKILNGLRAVQQELENKVTICNGGKILTRACPTNELIGAGSLVRALRQNRQTIATLELYIDPGLDKNNLK